MTFPGDRGVNWFSINISFREKRLALSKKWDSMEEGGKEDKEEAKPEVSLKEFCPEKNVPKILQSRK